MPTTARHRPAMAQGNSRRTLPRSPIGHLGRHTHVEGCAFPSQGCPPQSPIGQQMPPETNVKGVILTTSWRRMLIGALNHGQALLPCCNVHHAGFLPKQTCNAPVKLTFTPKHGPSCVTSSLGCSMSTQPFQRREYVYRAFAVAMHALSQLQHMPPFALIALR